MTDPYKATDSFNQGGLPDELTPPDSSTQNDPIKPEANKYSLIDKVRKNSKVAVSVLGVLALLAAVGAGVILVQRDQDIREKAALSVPSSESGAKCCTKFGACEANAGCGTGEACKLNENKDGSLKNSDCGNYVCWSDSGCDGTGDPPPPPPPPDQRPSICGDITADKTTIAPGESVTLRSSTNGTHANNFWYIMYNRDNLYPPPPENNPKPICVPTGSNPGDATWVSEQCPSGTVPLGYKASDTTGRSIGSITLPYEKIFINDANNANSQAKRVSVSAYFSIGDGPFSHIAPECVQYINAGEISAITPGKCSESCTSDAGCETGLVCSSAGTCRNPACTAEADCTCPAAATDMVCASYFRTADTDRMIQGTWTDDDLPTSSINACLDYMQANILNKPNCAQPGGIFVTIVLIDENKHTFDMPEINMSTEFVHSQFCDVPEETADLTIKFRQQGVTIPADDTVHVRLRKDGAIVHDFDWQPASSDNVGVWTVNLNKDKDGNSITPGTYTVLIKGRSHLQKKFTNVTLADGDNNKDWSTNKRDALRAGDVNGDNKITGIDIAKVLSFYIKGGFYIPITEESKYSDINKDLHISIQDISLIAVNWTDLTIEGDK